MPTVSQIIADHKFCSRCGNKMVEFRKPEIYQDGFDTKTGKPTYKASLGQWICERIQNVQNAYYEAGGHDNLTVLVDDVEEAKRQWTAEELAWEYVNKSN